MRYSPLQFLFADILYFIFYFVSPNPGHFGAEPVGLLPCASLQISALIQPVQPILPVPRFRQPLLFYNGCATAPGFYDYYGLLCHFLAPASAVSAPWPLLLVQLLHTMRTMQLSQQLPPRLPLRCSHLFAAPLFYFYLTFLFKAPVVLQLLLLGLLQLPCFRMFGLRGSVEI